MYICKQVSNVYDIHMYSHMYISVLIQFMSSSVIIIEFSNNYGMTLDSVS